MLIFVKILLLLWLINFAPPLLAHLLEERWDTPLDGGRRLKDGRPLLGLHKTRRGVAGGVLMGLAAGMILGLPWWMGLLAGALSMAGDLLTSFFKRRMGLKSGGLAPGFDQGFEGLLPFAVLGPYYSLDRWTVLWLVILFGIGAFGGSWFLKSILLKKPYEAYPRAVRTRVRLRELRACKITSKPLHHLVNFEDAFYYHLFMKGVFRMLGLYEKGKQNALDIKQSRMTFQFRDLPASFDGYTILFLSDLHLDGLEGLTDRILEMVDGQSADLCILGGDFRMDTYGPFSEALAHLERLLPALRARDGILGVLGNHDCLEIVGPLSERGVTFLVNESTSIERNGERIWIIGVDDPHRYRCHDLERAFDRVPAEAFTLFLAHSNEIYREACDYNPNLYLCGHSHAGQIQLPPFGPIFTHSRAPRSLCQGVWQHGSMVGYTTCGVGVSGVPVRFGSQGEIALITLKKGRAE